MTTTYMDTAVQLMEKDAKHLCHVHMTYEQCSVVLIHKLTETWLSFQHNIVNHVLILKTNHNVFQIYKYRSNIDIFHI